MCEVSMKELGDDYAAQAENLNDMIAKCGKRKQLAIRRGHIKEAARQDRLIELHTQQRNDLLRLAVWLRHYYDESAGQRQ